MQVVGYERVDGNLLVSGGPGDWTAVNDASDGGDGRDVDVLPLVPGERLAYTLGRRHCAGTLHDGGHVACDADAAPYCPAHSHTWVCARCTGTCLKDEMDCFDDHAVYLAAFAPDVFKVGVTKRHRLETRLREQGADRAAHLRTVENGRIAREIEADLAADGLTDRVRVPTKVAGLADDVDGVAWEALLSAFDPEATFAFDYGVDVDARPVPETMLTGVVHGTKGRVLLLDRDGTTYAVDLRSLVGHELEAGAGTADRQSSLGAFD